MFLSCFYIGMNNYDMDFHKMAVENLVLGLFNYNILVMDNADPDIRVIEISYNLSVSQAIQQEFGDEQVVQTIVCNMDEDTRQRSPYFRVAYAIPFSTSTIPINFKLQSFFRKIKMGLLNARCGKTVVIGLHAADQLESPLSMPSVFCNTNIDVLDFPWDGEVDLACLKPCGPAPSDPATTLCDIAGIVLPRYVPREVQNNILRFLECPTATCIKTAIDERCLQWDRGLFPMFRQREPRIPWHIAVCYNVTTVHRAIAVATKLCLVRSAL